MLDLFLQDPLIIIIAFATVIIGIFKGLGWGIITLYIGFFILYLFQFGNLSEFIFGIFTGVLANELSNILREKRQKDNKS